MKVIIRDKYDKRKEFDFENEKLAMIPNIGDRVYWFYTPTPKVIEKLWDYENDIVYIAVD